MFHLSPCIRVYKEAKALHYAGHHLRLFYMSEHSSLTPKYGCGDEIFDSVEALHYVNIGRFLANRLQKAVEWADVVHTHNLPDWHAGAIKKFSGKPVVHDVHDPGSLINPSYYGRVEAEVCRQVDALVAVSELLELYLKERYGKAVITLHNLPPRSDIPPTTLPKLSEKDGEVHVVYFGALGFGIGPDTHLQFWNRLAMLTERRIHVHIHQMKLPGQRSPESSDYLHIERVLRPDELILEISRYDCSLMPYGPGPSMHLALPNKLFEACAAGVPSASNASVLASAASWLKDMGAGLSYEDDSELVRLLESRAFQDIRIPDSTRFEMAMENEIGRLEGLYKQVVG